MSANKNMQTLSKELEKRNLPDVLVKANGESITTKEEWEKELRPHWLNLMLEHEYGKLPPYVKPEISTETNALTFAGKADIRSSILISV